MMPQPQTTSATSATGVFLNASSSALQFIVLGALIPDWAAWYAAIGLLATAFGLSVINYLIRRTGRASLIIISICLMISVATVMMSVSGISQIVDQAERGESFGFQDFC